MTLRSRAGLPRALCTSPARGGTLSESSVTLVLQQSSLELGAQVSAATARCICVDLVCVWTSAHLGAMGASGQSHLPELFAHLPYSFLSSGSRIRVGSRLTGEPLIVLTRWRCLRMHGKQFVAQSETKKYRCARSLLNPADKGERKLLLVLYVKVRSAQVASKPVLSVASRVSIPSDRLD